MAGASTPAMSLAVSRAGGLGSLAGAAWRPAEIEDEVARARAAGHPFAANLFVIETARPDGAVVEAALERLAPWYQRVGLEVLAAPNDFAQDFGAQFAALVRAALRVAAEQSAPLVFLEGSPAYYSRFGFEPGGPLGFRKPSLRIWMDRRALAARGLTVVDVENVVRPCHEVVRRQQDGEPHRRQNGDAGENEIGRTRLHVPLRRS